VTVGHSREALGLHPGPVDDFDPDDDLDALLIAQRVRRGLALGDAPALQLGRYIVGERLGHGALGVVYAAHDPELARDVAIKLVRPGPIEGEATEAAQARLLHEARALAKVSHPNVVHVYDVGTFGTQVWVAMELVAGGSLRTWLAQQQRSRAEIVAVLAAAGRGLAAAHAVGLIHRDVKPDNIVIDANARAYLVDFGLARAQAAPPTAGGVEGESIDEVTNPTITHSAALAGTPAYMAPELFRAGEVSEYSDQFAYCVTAYEALNGHRPFDGRTIAELAARVSAGLREPPPTGRASPPRRLRRAIERGLARDPRDRHPSMDALLAQLDPPRWKGLALTAGLAAVVAGPIVGAATFLGMSQRCTDAGAGIQAQWNPEQASRLRQRIVDAGPAYAIAVADGVVRGLDGRTQAWQRSATEACEAHARGEHSTPRFDAELACLDVARHRISTVVETLSRADADDVEGAVALVERLPAPTRCLEGRTIDPWLESPGDATVVAEVTALRGDLAELEVLGSGGEFATTAARGEAVLARAVELGVRPLQAAAALQVGDLWQRAGEAERARAFLTQALWTAQSTTDLEQVVRAAIELVYLEGVVRHDLEQATVWHDLGQSTLLAMGGDPELSGGLANAWASSAYARGDFDAAAAGYLAAIDDLTVAFGEDSGKLVAPLNNLAVMYIQLARFDEADERLVAALRIVVDTLGPGHPDNAGIAQSRAELAWRRGDLAGAERLYRQALEIHRASLGDEHRATVGNELNLAAVLASSGRGAEAIALLDGVLARARERFGPEDPLVLAGLETMANARAELHDFAGALAVHREVLAARERGLDPGHVDVGTALDNVIADLFDLGRRAEAAPLLERQLAIFERSLPALHPKLVDPLRRRGLLRDDAGDHEGAIADLQRALTIARAAPEPNLGTIETLERALASARRIIEVRSPSSRSHR
jgi:tetratricopeptide (TPR) repeat protein/predicted Ser/Thr protein kinase